MPWTASTTASPPPLETHSAITPMQIYCMLNLVSGALTESLAELGEEQ
ncbi:hypothetical protein [Methylobacter tundripaludum]|nr:hypothetical protein [Methylobacter tundripaludum]